VCKQSELSEEDDLEAGCDHEEALQKILGFRMRHQEANKARDDHQETMRSMELRMRDQEAKDDKGGYDHQETMHRILGYWMSNQEAGDDQDTCCHQVPCWMHELVRWMQHVHVQEWCPLGMYQEGLQQETKKDTIVQHM
jgi:hypothetical protein